MESNESTASSSQNCIDMESDLESTNLAAPNFTKTGPLRWTFGHAHWSMPAFVKQHFTTFMCNCSSPQPSDLSIQPFEGSLPTSDQPSTRWYKYAHTTLHTNGECGRKLLSNPTQEKKKTIENKRFMTFHDVSVLHFPQTANTVPIA